MNRSNKHNHEEELPGDDDDDDEEDERTLHIKQKKVKSGGLLMGPGSQLEPPPGTSSLFKPDESEVGSIREVLVNKPLDDVSASQRSKINASRVFQDA